jgi:hypothetical protein
MLSAILIPPPSAESVPSDIADVVVPISVAVKHEQFANELWRYKELAESDTKRAAQARLAAVLWRFLAAHEQCVADAAGAESFGLVTTVPSTSGRRRHPLAEIVGNAIEVTRDRYAELLVADPAIPVDRNVRHDRFRIIDGHRAADVAGADVLLLDDTWARGGRAQSAALALKRAGAKHVAIVVLGKHVDGDSPSNASYLERARERSFSWAECCVHRSGLW